MLNKSNLKQGAGGGGLPPLIMTMIFMVVFLMVAYDVGMGMDEKNSNSGQRILAETSPFESPVPLDSNSSTVFHSDAYGGNHDGGHGDDHGSEHDGGDHHGDGDHHGGHHSHPHYAILLPVFTVLIGVIMHYILGRVLHHAVPYTLAMFLFGLFLGCLLPVMREESEFRASVQSWSNIDGHVLLMVFLPGLLFKDAFSLDVHLFRKAFWQCWTMAFPALLAFTCLTAVVLMYAFVPNLLIPDGMEKGEYLNNATWLFCMLLGSILAATDPVAVSALLNEVGAPPRLKTHIAGESLLNDGAAIVFFNIFYKMDLYHFTGGEAGEDFNWGSGILYFIKLSLGSAALGIAYGFATVGFLSVLNHRYNYEENVVQVMATVGMAYLSFYMGESVLSMSGVISVVFCGIITKAYGANMINDQVAMSKFWDLLEHILNTVLFAVGGLVFGTVIVNDRDDDLPEEYYGINFTIGAKEWGYLFLLYIVITFFRSMLIGLFYPCVSRIGLGSSWQESVFMAWGGLRGAVGIALGISLENYWKNVSASDLSGFGAGAIEYQLGELYLHKYAARLWFFLAGGISMLTLLINGTTAGPLLKSLGLANATEFRKSIVERYNKSMILDSLHSLLRHLSDSQFSRVSFGAVRARVPDLKNITPEQFSAAVRRVKADPTSKLPNLSSFRASFPGADVFVDLTEENVDHQSSEEEEEISQDLINQAEAIEMRKVFTALLGKAYDTQIQNGFVDSRSGFVVERITASIQKMGDTVAQGEPINDFENCQSGSNLPGEFIWKKDVDEVLRAVACIEAHNAAQKAFKAEFVYPGEKVPALVATIIGESNSQVRLAEQSIASQDANKINSIMAHIVSLVLLNERVHAVGSYADRGLLNSTEAEHLIHALEHDLHHLDHFKDGHDDAGADKPEAEEGSAEKRSVTDLDLRSEQGEMQA